MTIFKYIISKCILLIVLCASSFMCHEAKDFDDSVLYKIDFEVPDFEKDPVSVNNYVLVSNTYITTTIGSKESIANLLHS